ncbi:MAG: hypothetical protein KME55_31945 [Nostoc indistinguendum CM1-VF10]|nr:hypothetical protein [Nostoc indistinguendum CM1-VF10]
MVLLINQLINLRPCKVWAQKPTCLVGFVVLIYPIAPVLLAVDFCSCPLYLLLVMLMPHYWLELLAGFQ